jgi:hypothetical protein
MSNFSTFFPAGGGGGEGAGINSYAPYNVTEGLGNPVGYNPTTGLYTNPVDDSVWLKTGKQVLETSPRTYPNATTFEDMFIAGGVPVYITSYYPPRALLWRYNGSTDYVFSGYNGTLRQTSYNPAGNSGGGQYTTIYTSPTHSGLSSNAWYTFACHENSSTWYDRGTPTGSVAIMPSYSTGGPNTSSISYYNMTPEIGAGYYVKVMFTADNFLYITNQSSNVLWEYELNPTTGAVVTWTNRSWDLNATLGNGSIRDMAYDPISGYIYFQGSTTTTEMVQLNKSTMAATGVVLQSTQNVKAANNSATAVVDQFTFGKMGSTNILFIQGNATTSARTAQYYSQFSDFTLKVGDSTAKTDASGSGKPLFIKLK